LTPDLFILALNFYADTSDFIFTKNSHDEKKPPTCATSYTDDNDTIQTDTILEFADPSTNAKKLSAKLLFW